MPLLAVFCPLPTAGPSALIIPVYRNNDYVF